VLSVDLVRVRKKKDQLELPAVRPEERLRALALAEQILALYAASVGESRAAIAAQLELVPHAAKEQRTFRALAKLADDEAEFESQPPLDPAETRRAVFEHAAARWRRGEIPTQARRAVLEAVGVELGQPPEVVERALFADLRDEERLVHAPAVDARALVTRWPRAEAQAVLLRATRLSISFRAANAAGARALFRRLKFHRLLFTLHAEPDGRHRVELDGPAALFEASTRYGLELALVLPLLDELAEYELRADVRWGKEKQPLTFAMTGGFARAAEAAPAPIPDAPAPAGASAATLTEELQRLVGQLRALDRGWHAAPAEAMIALPGVGLVVPDLTLTHHDGRVAHVEVMGHWSRAAVWRRVELIEAGATAPLVVAASERLRVSEEVLPPDAPGCLYVYKGVMRAGALLDRVERVARAPT
jgi:predicted nuclease of restriction endonuclease-like RecB superfamily